jgi:NTP pyrophosphatase (non-canonical NTP hydrolase)
MTTIEELQAEVVRFRDAREWARFHTPKNLAMGLQIEAGELSELFLWKDDAEIAAKLADPEYRARVAEELADVQVFLLFLSEATGIPLADAVRAKMLRNGEKYPVEKARGNAKKYDEL